MQKTEDYDEFAEGGVPTKKASKIYRSTIQRQSEKEWVLHGGQHLPALHE